MWNIDFHTPSNPVINSNLSKFTIYNLAISIFLAFIWNFYRNKKCKYSNKYFDGVQRGLKYSVLGQILKFFVLVSTIIPFLFILIHTYDTAGCNRKDLAPFWDGRAINFIVLWLECFFICFFYRLTKSLFKQFFLIPTHLEHADYVCIWQRISKESDVTCVNDSKMNKFLKILLRPFNKLSCLLNGEFSGYILHTVKVNKNKSGSSEFKSHFELLCVRYWYSDRIGRFISMEDRKNADESELSNYTGCLGKDIYSVSDIMELEQLKPNILGFDVEKRVYDSDSNETTEISKGPVIGLNSNLVNEQKQSHGKNEIFIKTPSLFYGLLNEIMDPLTIFQLLVVASFNFQGYLLFAVKWVPMMVISIFANIRTHFMNIKNVRKLAGATGPEPIKAIRNGEIVDIKGSELVPGDVIYIYEDTLVPCDLLLLSGSAVVNESMLTGESAEVLKMPISECEHDKISPEDGPYSNKRYFLYAGTQVTAVYNNVGRGVAFGNSMCFLGTHTSSTRSTDSMNNIVSNIDMSDLVNKSNDCISNIDFSNDNKYSTRDGSTTIALVIRTGICTLRGRIIRSILYPSRYSFGLYDQLPIAWLSLSIIVAIIVFKQGRSFNWNLFTFFFALGSINSTFPLYLKVLSTLLQNVSSKRLSKNFNVKSLIPTRIMLAGKLRIVCFDKTGTLTNDHLDFVGLSPIELQNKNGLIDVETAGKDFKYKLSDEIYGINEIQEKFQMAFLSIRSCTSLSHSPSNFGLSKEIITNPRIYYNCMNGNDTDKALFSVTNSYFEKNPDTERVLIKSIFEDYERNGHLKESLSLSCIEVIRIFPFDYNRRLMSIIVYCKFNDSYYLFTKGAPESIQKLFVGSTGDEFKQRLDSLSSRGYYLISTGYKKIEKNLLNLYLILNRNEVENELTPLGILIFENSIRDEAPEVLRQLVKSDILPVIVTGDSPLTGLNAALKLGIVNRHFGLTAISELIDCHSVERIVWKCIETKEIIPDEEIYSDSSKYGNLVLTGDCFNILIKEHFSSVYICGTNDSNQSEDIDLEQSQKIIHKMTRIDYIINRVMVYARMSPNNKVEVVSLFMKRGIVTGMVGDGGNDCGALRTSHVGLSFSKGDASLVAPFNSSNSDLNSVLEIVREGRSSLASVMSILLYLISYGIMTSLDDTLLTHFAFASIPDISSSFVAFFAQTLILIGLLFNSPCRRLAAARPFGSIATFRFSMAFLTPILTYIIGYFVMFARLNSRTWFQSSKEFNLKLPVQNWFMRMDNVESTCAWIYTAIQLVATAICYTMGSQFRKPFYTNFFMLIPIFINIIVYVSLIFTGPNVFTCAFRVNCDTYNTQKSVIKLFGINIINPSTKPFSGPNGSNILPFSWRIEFVIINVMTVLLTLSIFSIITKHREKCKTSIQRKF